MYWGNLEQRLSSREECREDGCSSPADTLDIYSNGHMGSESAPRPKCAEHAQEDRTMVRWEASGWDWLRRSYWDGQEPLD